MFRKFKISKREKPDEGWYSILNSKELRRSDWDLKSPYYQILSLDPATKNFAISVEKRWIDNRIETVSMAKYDFSGTRRSGKQIIREDPINCNMSYHRALETLLQYKDIIKKCHYIISERQLPQNYKAVRMSQHVLSLIMVWCQESVLKPIVIEVNPILKGKVLGAPPGCTDKQLKSWSVERCHQLLTERQDQLGIDLISAHKKKDDLADTRCQTEAFFRLTELIPTNYFIEIKREGLLKVITVHEKVKIKNRGIKINTEPIL